MNQLEMVEAMDAIQQGACQVATRMLVVRQQGRMLALNEAREVDALSKELAENVRVLSAHSLDEIESPEVRKRAGELLVQAQKSLQMVASPDGGGGTPHKGPRAASSRLSAYCKC